MRVNEFKTVLDRETRISLLVKEHGFNYKLKGKLNTPEGIYHFMEDNYQMSSLTEEHVYMLALDSKCQLIGVFKISSGTVNASIVDVRGLFMKALLCNCVHITLIHNHPSGETTPSSEDIRITKRLIEGANTLGLNFLDHIIIGENYYSLKENGLM